MELENHDGVWAAPQQGGGKVKLAAGADVPVSAKVETIDKHRAFDAIRDFDERVPRLRRVKRPAVKRRAGWCAYSLM